LPNNQLKKSTPPQALSLIPIFHGAIVVFVVQFPHYSLWLVLTVLLGEHGTNTDGGLKLKLHQLERFAC
jgi:hypothetical protein